MVDKTNDTVILNTLHSAVSGTNKLVHADEVYDEGFSTGENNQSTINSYLLGLIRNTSGGSGTEVPQNPVAGQIFYSTEYNQLLVYNGQKWVNTLGYDPELYDIIVVKKK